jgi:hypothetical protein
MLPLKDMGESLVCQVPKILEKATSSFHGKILFLNFPFSGKLAGNRHKAGCEFKKKTLKLLANP